MKRKKKKTDWYQGPYLVEARCLWQLYLNEMKSLVVDTFLKTYEEWGAEVHLGWEQ